MLEGISEEDVVVADCVEDDNEIRSRTYQLKAKYHLFCDEFKKSLKAATTIRNIINVVFIISVSAICFQQCYSQLNEYFKYSVRSQVSHSIPNSTLFLIPGITVCNNNRIRMDKLLNLSKTLKERFEAYANIDANSPFTLTEASRIDRMRNIRELIESSINISSLISDSPVSKLLELSRGSMIKDVNCNSLWGEQFNCENFRIIESFQGSACYTMFYLGSLLEALTNELAYDFNTTLLGGKKKINSFDEHELAEILVDFEPFEHADFQNDVGGKLVVHSTGHVGSVRDMSYNIQPGKSYEIVLSRRMTKRLPPPYKSDCFDYRGLNSDKFTNTSAKQPASPSSMLDTTGCTRNCIVKHSTKHCNCWPKEIPYYPDDETLIVGSKNYRSCEWLSGEAQQNFSESQYIKCYKDFHTKCRGECRRGCWTEDYKIHIMSSSWPARSSFLRATYQFEKSELQRLKHCCAKISLKYLEYMETKQIMYPQLTWAQLVSNIGGIVSGLIGVSAVTFYRYLTRNVLGCRVVSDYNLPVAGNNNNNDSQK